jgi:hypothetical protein
VNRLLCRAASTRCHFVTGNGAASGTWEVGSELFEILGGIFHRPIAGEPCGYSYGCGETKSDSKAGHKGLEPARGRRACGLRQLSPVTVIRFI